MCMNAQCVHGSMFVEAGSIKLLRARGPGQKPGDSLYTRNGLSRGGQGESLVPHYTRGSDSFSLSHGGQGISLVPFIHAEVSVSLSVSRSRRPGRKPGASIYTRKRLSPSFSQVNTNCSERSLGNKPFREHANQGVGPGQYCSPRLRIPFKSRNEGSTSVG